MMNTQDRVYTIETRVLRSNMGYFKEFSPLYAGLCRRIWQDLKHNINCNSKYVTGLCHKYGFMKRTVNSALRQMKGRMLALKALQKVQIKDKENKVVTFENKIEQIKAQINRLKVEVEKHPNDKQLVMWYNNKKKKLYSWQVKKDKLINQINNYYNGINTLDICFGSKAFFKKQYNLEFNGYKTHEKWYNEFCKQRDKQVYYIGTSEETCGNQMCQLTYLRNKDRFTLKVRKEYQFCQSNKRNDKDNYVYLDINFKHRKDFLLFALENHVPLSYTFNCKNGKWYISVSFVLAHKVVTDNSNGCVGLDFNNGFIALTETDKYGNIVNIGNIYFKNRGTSNKAKSEMSEIVSKLVRYTKNRGKALCIEDLNFSKKKSTCIRKGKKRYNEMLHTLDYSRYKKFCSDYSITYGVMLILVNPAYTSKIGKQKYAYRKKLTVHNAAAYVIARRGQGYNDEYIV